MPAWIRILNDVVPPVACAVLIGAVFFATTIEAIATGIAIQFSP